MCKFGEISEEMINVAVFVSGNGTNCERLIRYFSASEHIRIALVLSTRKEAFALVRAERAGVRTCFLPKTEFERPERLLPLLERSGIGFIVLAGFLSVVPAFLIDAYRERIINLHPALLPKFGGLGMYGRHVHEAVKAAGEKETGMTVHYVTSEVDGGPVLAQFRTPIGPEDSVEEIASKEHELEMAHFPGVVEAVVRRAFGLPAEDLSAAAGSQAVDFPAVESQAAAELP